MEGWFHDLDMWPPGVDAVDVNIGGFVVNHAKKSIDHVKRVEDESLRVERAALIGPGHLAEDAPSLERGNTVEVSKVAGVASVNDRIFGLIHQLSEEKGRRGLC